MARRKGLYEVDGELVSERNFSSSLARAMPASRVLAVSPIEQVERHGDPQKVTGSLQRSPLHAAGCRRCLHFGKCALQPGTRTFTDISESR